MLSLILPGNTNLRIVSSPCASPANWSVPVPVEPSAGALSCHRQSSNTAALSTISAIALNRPNLRQLPAEPVSGKFSLTSRKLPGIDRLKTHINGGHHNFQDEIAGISIGRVTWTLPGVRHSACGQPGLRLSAFNFNVFADGQIDEFYAPLRLFAARRREMPGQPSWSRLDDFGCSSVHVLLPSPGSTSWAQGSV